jgi:hypothetical protein
LFCWPRLTCHFQFNQKELKECEKETEGETVVPAEASSDGGEEEKKSKAQNLNRYWIEFSHVIGLVS